MSRQRLLLLSTALCLVVAAALHLGLSLSDGPAEQRMRDSLMRLGRTASPNPDLVFLAIDNASVSLDPELDVDGLYGATLAHDPKSRRALELMSRGWPWNRETFALIMERLVGAGARVIVLDCLFFSGAEGDAEFRDALNRHGERLVLGSNFVSPGGFGGNKPLPSTYQAPIKTLVPETSETRVGFTNFFTARDGVVRGAHFRVEFNDPIRAREHLSLAAQTVAAAGRAGIVPSGISGQLIRFTGPPRITFRPRPVFEIFVPEYWQQNYAAGEFFRDKIVVVGAEGSWQKDELNTPFGAMPGTEVHLNAINALWRNAFLQALPWWGDTIVITFAALLALGLTAIVRSPWLRAVGLVLANAAAFGCALLAYNGTGVYLPMIAPLLALNGAMLAGFAVDFALERIEKRRLRRAMADREDLTQMIVHDLRSPLTVVSGYMEALEAMAGGKLSEREAKFISEAQRGARDMRELITTLLDVGRLEAGEMPLRLGVHDVSAIARGVVERVAPVVKDRTVSCEVPPGPVVAKCDGEVLRRVIENFTSNAVKYARGTICLEVDLIGGAVAVEVRDDGEGIPVDQHQRIFEKFGQVDGGGNNRHSTGIGLAFCKMAIEAQGGEIGVRSAPGQGSAFWFRVPAASETDATEKVCAAIPALRA